MSRNCIVTINVGPKWNCLGQITTNTMANYARRIKADFININTIFVPHSLDCCIVFEKFQLYDLLAIYDRAMLVDYDAIISNNCPDIFKIVPEDKLGVTFHHKIQGRTQDVIDELGDTGVDWEWESPYWDSGVIVVSKIHRDLFEYSNKHTRLAKCSCAEERTFNYRIYKYKIPIYDIGHRFHFLPGHEREIKLDPFIIHWAGGARGGKDKVLAKAEQIKSDIVNYKDWKSKGFPKQWR